jgi:hypothetical protein
MTSSLPGSMSSPCTGFETVLCVAFPQEVMARPSIAAKTAEFEGRDLRPADSIDRDRLFALLVD